MGPLGGDPRLSVCFFRVEQARVGAASDSEGGRRVVGLEEITARATGRLVQVQARARSGLQISEGGGQVRDAMGAPV